MGMFLGAFFLQIFEHFSTPITPSPPPTQEERRGMGMGGGGWCILR